MERSQAVRRRAHDKISLEAFEMHTAPSSDLAQVQARWWLPPVESHWQTLWWIYAEGVVDVEAAFKPTRTNLALLPCLGMQMTLPATFDRIDGLAPDRTRPIATGRTRAWGDTTAGCKTNSFTDIRSRLKAGTRWTCVGSQ
ncbi:MAG: hypothetical protein RMN51_00870 [Verrucomicrobiota bacterium]|nr:beta-galactosidase small subunit [Limisphaera sp.]MDW8380651.1 hypothetical protein [Verrucomicrobiota bacterium]